MTPVGIAAHGQGSSLSSDLGLHTHPQVSGGSMLGMGLGQPSKAARWLNFHLPPSQTRKRAQQHTNESANPRAKPWIPAFL